MLMRIQHLLEVKSNQERRNVTMDDLANATNISRSALYKMNSDPNYNPSKAVMERLATYFQCSLDDLFDRTTKFTFELASAFPRSKALSVTVLSVLAASNDMTFLQRLWLRYENEKNNGIIREVRNGEKSFLLFLGIGFLREGMIAFRRLLKDPAIQDLLEKIDDDSKKSFEFLKEESDGKHSLYNTILRDLRNDAIFHYNQKAFSNALQSIKQNKGHFIVGKTSAETRFLIADDIRSEIIRSSVDFDMNDEHEQEKMHKLIAAMGHFLQFSSGLLVAYLDYLNVMFD